MQDELLNEYRLVLYTANLSEVWSSGIKYGSVVPVNIGGLSNGTKYFVRATGKTVNGFNLDTGFIPFICEYEATGLYSVLKLENREYEGTVRIISNIVVINGKSNPDPPDFIDNEIVDLSGNGTYVTFDEGFTLDGDFLIQLIGYGFKQNESIMTLSDGYNNIDIYWRKGMFLNDDGTQSLHIFAELKSAPPPYYVVYSNHIQSSGKTWLDVKQYQWIELMSKTWGDYSDKDDMMYVSVRRINGLYEIKISEI
jgi:hypothetical protein